MNEIQIYSLKIFYFSRSNTQLHAQGKIRKTSLCWLRVKLCTEHFSATDVCKVRLLAKQLRERRQLFYIYIQQNFYASRATKRLSSPIIEHWRGT